MISRTLLTFLAIAPALWAQNGNREGHDNMEPVVPKELIPPAPVLSPEAALESFQLAEGFVIEPFATEPMIDKPVALDYDPAGRLWVVEMRGYMPDIDGTGEDKPIGRITVLEDTDQDGKADKSTIFLEELLLPRAIAVYPDGILFADEKELRFIKRDGLKPIGTAEIVVKNFVGKGNVEHKANGLVRGMDNWLYNTKSSQRIRRIDGKWVAENTAFRGQWGVTFDDYGRIFYDHNSQFLLGDFFAPNLLSGNGSVNTKISDASSIGSNAVYPIRVTPGVNRGYIQKSNGYDSDSLDPKTFKLKTCTAAAGMVIYRGTNYPEEWKGRGLTTESSVNLVKAMNITEKGTKFVGEHTYKNKEWLASTDERFRPVNIYNAPDGSVYLLDFYHGIIQHKTYVTSYLRKQYLDRGLDKPALGNGRIYRIRHEKGNLESVPDMDMLSSPELVNFLSHANGWHRDMAQRVLGSREADDQTIELLEKLASNSSQPLGQIHALWTLEGMGRLTAGPIEAALASKDSKVICSALWASTTLDESERSKLASKLLDLSPLNVEQTVYLTRALGPLATKEAYERINELVNQSKSDFVSAAAFSGIPKREADFTAALGDKLTDQKLIDWIKQSSMKKATDHGEALKGKKLASFKRGKALFQGEAACFACHGPDGSGLINLGPPLDESEWVTGSPDILGKILLHGITGPITVNGIKYETTAEMPALSSNPTFTDAKIADIMTYVRNAWSNEAPPVTSDFVKRLRKKTADQSGRPYTEQTLK
ncbi:c-type cytochrome [Luteolibacter algae]|uniref:C-type cytochrome n=1 Tax=Luteolibacter algae TaxID=454151 RepID=A0ABW5D6L0_9BACT